MMKKILILFTVFVLTSALGFAQPKQWREIQRIFHSRGDLLPGGMLRFEFPRTNLKVTVNGAPADLSALTTWFEFSPPYHRAKVKGYLVMQKSSAFPVRMNLANTVGFHHITETIIKGSSPPVAVIRFHGVGNPARLAIDIDAILFFDTHTPGIPRPFIKVVK